MATIKSFTDISQSKKLAEILSVETADMHYSKDFDGSWFVDLAEYTSVKIPKYVGNVEEHLLPCWSLTALLDVLPNDCGVNKEEDKFVASYLISDECGAYTKTNPIDACYEMIIHLHELNLL
jgi:hypothetical protein